MKSIVKRMVSILLLVTSILSTTVYCHEIDNEEMYCINAKRDLLVLILSYPKHIISVEKDEDNLIYLIMKSGKRILYDDKKKKTYEEKLENPDLQDMLEEPYPLCEIKEALDGNKDPGRIRHYILLNEVYGDNEQSIRRNLINISTKYGEFQFNNVNGAGDSLRNSMSEVFLASRENPQIEGFIHPTSGTFNYRYIQDTGRLSAHSYGIAIDLKRDSNDYWKWVNKEKGSKRIASYPSELVKSFENNGFIWGGKWAHFDILHFEYRPEFILKAKYFGDKVGNENLPWDTGVDKVNNVDEVIGLIEEKIGSYKY